MCGKPLAAEVGGDDGRAAEALERAVGDADADAAVGRLEEVRAVTGAREPHPEHRLRRRARTGRPGEVLAGEAADVEGAHAGGEVAVGEDVLPEQGGRPRAGGRLEPRVEPERPEAVRGARRVDGAQPAGLARVRAGCRGAGGGPKCEQTCQKKDR